jgi:hypothetical protein
MTAGALPPWLVAGVARRCRGNRYCAAEGVSWTAPLLVAGAPTGGVTGECTLCSRFICGACAVRVPQALSAGGETPWLWRLACPHCGTPLGEAREDRAVVCSGGEAVAGAERRQGGWTLLPVRPDDDPAARLGAEARAHAARALARLAALRRVGSLDEAVMAAEQAAAAAPGEPVAWLYCALLRAHAGYPAGAGHALGEWARCAPEAAGALGVARGGAAPALPRWREELRRRAAALDEEWGAAAPELAAFHHAVERQRRGEAPLGEHLPLLFAGRDPPEPVRGFLDALRVERELDFDRAESERQALIAALADTLSDDELRLLLLASSAYSTGIMGAARYCALLRTTAAEHEIRLDRWPTLQRYLEYLEAAEAIDADALSAAVWEAQEAGYQTRCSTPAERRLAREATRIHLEDRLLDLLARTPPAAPPAAEPPPPASPPRPAEKPSLWKRLTGRFRRG